MSRVGRRFAGWGVLGIDQSRVGDEREETRPLFYRSLRAIEFGLNRLLVHKDYLRTNIVAFADHIELLDLPDVSSALAGIIANLDVYTSDVLNLEARLEELDEQIATSLKVRVSADMAATIGCQGRGGFKVALDNRCCRTWAPAPATPHKNVI